MVGERKPCALGLGIGIEGTDMRALSRFVDLRDGEGPVALGAFAVLLLVITAHSMLETARDALFLAKLPPRQLNVVYIVVALLSLVVGPLSGLLARRVGTRRALVCSLVFFAGLTGLLFQVRAHSSAIYALYTTSGLLGAVLVPQFWAVLGGSLTIGQARRLFGFVATAGVFGGVLGSALAVGLLQLVPVATLILIAGGILLVAAMASVLSPEGDAPEEPKAKADGSPFEREPLLTRIAILVALATATVLVVDYLFKLKVARTVPPAELGQFFARFYTGLNALSIVVQLGVAGWLVRRVGVAAALGFTPFLLLSFASLTLFSGGALLAVLALKATDGGLRHSIHRVSTELLYLPVPASMRDRAKPFIDGAVARSSQAIVAGALLGLTMIGLGSGRTIGMVLIGLAAAWLAVAVSMRKPYLALFRRSLATGAIDEGVTELDLASAEVLVERMASAEPFDVIAAMNVLAGKERSRLIPALVLHHDDEQVLARALEIFADSDRTDWIPLGERLVRHGSERVRSAAIRALATHGATPVLEEVANDASPRVRAYAVACMAAKSELDMTLDPRVRALLEGDSIESRIGLLTAVSDIGAPASTRNLLRMLTEDPRVESSTELVSALASAIGRSRDASFVSWLVGHVEKSAGRSAIRAALCALGEPAFEAVVSALEDTKNPRRLRVHLPRTLSRFATRRAAEVLVDRVTHDPDGLVRYKSMRGLGRLVADHPELRPKQRVIESLLHRNVLEHLRLLTLRVHVAPRDERDADEPTTRLLAGLLDDKMEQSLERAFRVLKIGYPEEDLHGVHTAALGKDKRQRANAAEFLDTLLAGPDHVASRTALRVVLDDLPAPERAERAARVLPNPPPRTREEALEALLDDADLMVATLATEYALRHGDVALVAAAGAARSQRPALVQSACRFFLKEQAAREPRHA